MSVPPPLLLADFAEAERDVLHWITCKLYTPWLDPILINAQEKVIAVPLFALLLVGLAFVSPRRAWHTFLAALLGLGIAMGIADLMWLTIERKRPPHVYEHLLRTPEERATCAAHPDALVVRKGISRSPSFPSKHALTAGVFATVTTLASWKLGILAWAYGLLVIVGRVYGAKHWPTDVVAGAVLGIACGWLAWRLIPWLLGKIGKRHHVEVATADAGDPEPGQSSSKPNGPPDSSSKGQIST